MPGRKNGDRYKKLVSMGKPNDCWQWLGSINKRTGYGKKQWRGETWLAHRWVWTMLFGSIPKDMTINHKCSNRSCVNPHHMEVITQAENCRHGSGATLTKEQVLEIRAVPQRRGDRKEIASKYGVSEVTISDIRSRRSWKDI